MKAVDILRDDVYAIEEVFQFDDRIMPRVWLCLFDNCSPMFIPLPDTLRIRHECMNIR